MRNPAIFSAMAILLLTPACVADGGSDEPDDATTSGSTTSPTTTAAQTLTGGTEGSSGPPPGDGSSGSSSSSGTDETTGTTGEPVDNHWGALVLGTLFTDDLMTAQATHDAVAMAGEPTAMMAGDYGHDALLGTTWLDTAENQFLAIDQWETLEGAQRVYGDPEFQTAFGMLFARPPSLELFERREDWHGWGSLEAGDGDAHWFVVVRGRLAEADLDAARAMHDAVAMEGEAAATALGDVAHVVWVGTPEDPQQFFAVDVWTSDEMIAAFYGDPKFQAAFGMLFEAPPTVGVYASTDWYQW